jgi:hypothetical protein
MKIQPSWKVLYIVFWVIGVCLTLIWNTFLDVVVAFFSGSVFATLLLILNPSKLENRLGILIQAVIITLAVYFVGALPIEFLCNYGLALYSCDNNHLDIGYPMLLFFTSVTGVLISLVALYYSLREK